MSPAPSGEAFGVSPPLTAAESRRDEGARAALWLGPDEWLLIAEDPAASLERDVGGGAGGGSARLVDVSHRQVAIEIGGAGAARLLERRRPARSRSVRVPVGMVDAHAADEGRDRAVAARAGSLPPGVRALVRALCRGDPRRRRRAIRNCADVEGVSAVVPPLRAEGRGGRCAPSYSSSDLEPAPYFGGPATSPP